MTSRIAPASAVEIPLLEAQLVRARVDARRSRACPRRQAGRTPGAAAELQLLDPLAGAGHERQAGLELRGNVGAERHREIDELLARRFDSRRGASEPQHRGGVGRAAAEAGRDRDPLLDRDPHRRPVPAEALAKGGKRECREVPSPARRGRRPRPLPPTRSSVTSSASVTTGTASRSRAGRRVAAGRRRGRGSASPARARRAASEPPLQPAPTSSTNSSAARAAPPARRPGGRSPPARRARRRARSSEPSAIETERASALRRCAKAACTSLRTAARTGRRDAPQPHERRVDVRLGLEDGARDRPQELHLAGELDDHGRDPVGLAARRCGKAVGDLALDHQAPEPDAAPAPRSCARSPARPRRREGWPRPSTAAARSALRSTSITSPSTSSTFSWPASASRSTGSSLASVSTTWTWRTRLARYSLRIPRPAADLEHDVVVGRARRSARSRPGCCRRRGSSGRAHGWGERRTAPSARGSRARARSLTSGRSSPAFDWTTSSSCS